MKKITSPLLTLIFLITAWTGLAQSLKADLVSPTDKVSPIKVEPDRKISHSTPNPHQNVLRPDGTHAIIHDNGPIINVPGNPNYSRVEDLTLGLSTYGFAAIQGQYTVADEFAFTVPMMLTSIEFFAYQTGGPSNSINNVSVQIWDGKPDDPTSTVVWGDRTTNRFGSVVSSGVYRDIESNPGDMNREIQKVTANTPNLLLNPGTYWVEFSFAGTGTSGPWAPPITISGTAATGNGMQYDINLSTWGPLQDTGSGASQGLPFIVHGSPATFPGLYCGPLLFPTDVEPITRVILATIDNSSSEVLNATPEHEDFTSISSLVEEGQSYTITLEGNTNGNNTNRFVVFADWNQNGILDDTGEVYEITDLLQNSTGVDGKQVSGTIAIPMGAKTGSTRMRVKKILGTADYLNPCLGADNGQAEDYTLEVVGAGKMPPSNDNCATAISVSCGDIIVATTKNASTDFSVPVCNAVSSTSPGIWYVLDDTSGVSSNITISLCSPLTEFNTKLSIYTGDCSGLVCFEANDDFCGEQSEVSFGSNGNTTYYIYVHSYDGQKGTFEMTVTCNPIIGIADNPLKGFSFYPNPTKDNLILSKNVDIQNISIFNMMGQKVIDIDGGKSEIFLGSLAQGTYFLKVKIAGETGVYKIIKE